MFNIEVVVGGVVVLDCIILKGGFNVFLNPFIYMRGAEH